MNNYILLVSATLYFGLLFTIASMVNKGTLKIDKFFSPSNVYSISIAVYCTAWTFFGSVGNASKTGIGFLPVYLGPTIFMPVIVLIWYKILKICKEYRITNIADFISSRYGNSNLLGVLVTLFYVFGVVPYIALQLKAIGLCLNILSKIQIGTSHSVFYISVILIIFTILYGARNIDASEKHRGLIAAISFESIVKLIAFLVVGVYVSFQVFDSPLHIFTKFNELLITNNTATTFFEFKAVPWILTMLISALAMILLPRQFQVAIIENTSFSHLKKVVWLFPLYLLLINIFVIPIAMGGLLVFGNSIDPDTFVLAFPLQNGNVFVTILIFLGGLSAASGMVIMETIALSTMLSNNIGIPLFLATYKVDNSSNLKMQRIVKNTRRMGIVFIIMSAYFFELYVAEKISLISIGLISFAAVSQLAPSFLGGLYWREATLKAAISSIIVGFVLWFYTLILPTLAGSSAYADQIIQNGLFNIPWLRPGSLFYFTDFDPLSHGIFWSLLLNVLTFVGVSIYTKRTPVEIIQSEKFVMIDAKNSILQKYVTNEVLYYDLFYMFNIFFGAERGNQLLSNYMLKHHMKYEEKGWAPNSLVIYSEKLLAGAIGPISTKMIIGNISKHKPISMTEVLDILKENQQTLQLNKELKKKSNELKKVTDELRNANEKLKQIQEQKDEFLYTVTHELRTPLTSIRALSEVLFDNPDLDEAEKEQYLGVVIKETERMTHLITQVLNLEKYESGQQKLNLNTVDFAELMSDVSTAFGSVMKNNNIQFSIVIPNNMLLVRIDKILIEQVLYNLLSNAIKYTNDAITVAVVENDNEIIVSVIDNGPGIEESQKDQVFDKFYQIKNKKLQKPDGSGLGLAISKNIIEMHNKQLWIENNHPSGAIFSFNLALI